MLNQVYVLGKIVSKPELKHDGYIPQTYLLIAAEMEEGNLTFIDVLVTGKHAETCYSQLEISSKVLVEGRFFSCPKTSVLKILAQRVQILDDDDS